jgi:hypothetical protein
MFSNLFFENRAVYEISWKSFVELGRPQMAVWRMRIACWISRAKNKHSDCVILIVFPPLQWLHERSATFLLCTYIDYIVSLTRIIITQLNRHLLPS